jgi:hypothetical protein
MTSVQHPKNARAVIQITKRRLNLSEEVGKVIL